MECINHADKTPRHEKINTKSAFDMMERILGMSELEVERYSVIRKSEIDLLLMLSLGAFFFFSIFKQHGFGENERKCFVFIVYDVLHSFNGALF